MKFLKENWQPFALTVAAVIVGLWLAPTVVGFLNKAKSKVAGA